MLVSSVQVMPPSLEKSRSALAFQVKLNRVIAILVGFTGSTAMLGSVPPAVLALMLGSFVKMPATASFGARDRGWPDAGWE